MGQPQTTKPFFTIEEYLKQEADSPNKNEFHDGGVFAMAGGSFRHSAICSNIHRRIGNLIDSKDCITFDSNLKLWIPKRNAFVYPDIMVVCGKIDCYADQHDIILNPLLIVEVLSPSTESFDRGGKFEYYRSLPSLMEYVLISQNTPMVETYFRQKEKFWLYSATTGLEEILTLQSLSIEIALKDIYQKLEDPF